MIIYRALNIANGKSYIGQTTKSLEKRIKEHQTSKKKTSFSAAIKKYGIENFEWTTLEYCDSKDELNEMEYHYIMQYGTYKNGYNMTYGGDGGNCGNQFTKLPEEDRNKIHFLNTMEASEKQKYIDLRYSGDNHYTKRYMTDKEFEIWKQKRSGSNNGRYYDHRTFEEIHGTEKSQKLKQLFSQQKRGNTHRAKEYLITYPDGKIEKIISLKTFCVENNLSRHKMMDVASGRLDNYKNIKCKYVEGVKDVSDL